MQSSSHPERYLDTCTNDLASHSHNINDTIIPRHVPFSLDHEPIVLNKYIPLLLSGLVSNERG